MGLESSWTHSLCSATFLGMSRMSEGFHANIPVLSLRKATRTRSYWGSRLGLTCTFLVWSFSRRMVFFGFLWARTDIFSFCECGSPSKGKKDSFIAYLGDSRRPPFLLEMPHLVAHGFVFIFRACSPLGSCELWSHHRWCQGNQSLWRLVKPLRLYIRSKDVWSLRSVPAINVRFLCQTYAVLRVCKIYLVKIHKSMN